MRPVSELVPDILRFPYAVITPDGRWFDHGDMPERDWQDALRSLLDRHRDRTAVAMDCHC
ncbi:hypothetical protein ACFQVD_26130 [Streptosporangium amethystogenes subsp. fukuiense]|uniref:Uncharacterized protein n=1 Tax=Streptosporangium amethystogenes subsp. fukuiense TaxID=698418 RepID=A0ABW2T5S3_9ACTN